MANGKKNGGGNGATNAPARAASGKFKLRVKTPILKDDIQYEIGDTIELTKEEAQSMPFALEFDQPFALADSTATAAPPATGGAPPSGEQQADPTLDPALQGGT